MNKNPELKTICDYIRFAASCFNEAGLYYGHGTDNAWDEAVALILHTLHLHHTINPIVLSANLTHAEQVKILELINLRIKHRKPTPYLTHQAWFCGISFYVDERVLIPRSSICELIENQFSPWISPGQVSTILDLCTGSGCIAIACAKYFPNAKIDASDISTDALAVAKINILRHQVQNQVQLFESDLFKNLSSKKYDVILSNPPYVSLEEMQELPPEYLHEPKLGLTASESGLEFVIKILQDADKFLSPDGILIVEVGNAEAALIDKFPQIPFKWLEFENSEDGIFLLTADELHEYKHEFQFDKN